MVVLDVSYTLWQTACRALSSKIVFGINACHFLLYVFLQLDVSVFNRMKLFFFLKSHSNKALLIFVLLAVHYSHRSYIFNF